MQKATDLVINITFLVFLVIMIYLNYANLLESKLDYGISILAIVISIILLLFKNISILDIAHFLYCGLYLFSVADTELSTLVSQNGRFGVLRSAFRKGIR